MIKIIRYCFLFATVLFLTSCGTREYLGFEKKKIRLKGERVSILKELTANDSTEIKSFIEIMLEDAIILSNWPQSYNSPSHLSVNHISNSNLDKNNLWKDRALVELNQAVLYSFRKAGVKIIDHHSASKQIMQFMRQEEKEGRDETADWSWIVPPVSGSTMEVFHTEMNNVIKSPNYFYQENAWG